MIYRINTKGFTLIELMITVSIIGILAAIAIPNFLSYQYNAKTSEAKLNIGGIKICQDSFKAQYDFYAVCNVNPGAVIKGKQPWSAPAVGNGWNEIGFKPSGNLYYIYEVTVGGNLAPAAPATRGGIAAANLADNMCIGAAGDIDGNGVNGEFGFSTDIAVIAGAGNILRNVSKNNLIENITPGEF